MSYTKVVGWGPFALPGEKARRQAIEDAVRQAVESEPVSSAQPPVSRWLMTPTSPVLLATTDDVLPEDAPLDEASQDYDEDTDEDPGSPTAAALLDQLNHFASLDTSGFPSYLYEELQELNATASNRLIAHVVAAGRLHSMIANDDDASDELKEVSHQLAETVRRAAERRFNAALSGAYPRRRPRPVTTRPERRR